PLDALPVPPNSPIALPRAPPHVDMHVIWCCAHAYHREQRRHAIPIALAASPLPNCPRLRALALFGRRPLQRLVSLVIPATKNLHRSRHFSTSIFDLARSAPSALRQHERSR